MKDIKSKKGRTNQKGQALVETALVLFLLLLLVLGIFEFGRAMYTKNTLVNAARAGARAAVVQAKPLPDRCEKTFETPCSGTGICKAVCDSLFQGIPKDKVTVSVTPTTPVSGDTVTVTVTLTGFQTFTKIISITNVLKGEASMRYEL